MTCRRVPRVALALLEWALDGNEPLAGDLVEEFARRDSRTWFWAQVLGAIATASSRRGVEIRPLRLVELQPADAVERSRRFGLRFRRVNLSAGPAGGVGGLGLVVLGGLMTRTMPAAWALFLAAALAGLLLGVLAIVWREGTAAANAHATAISAAAAIRSARCRGRRDP